MSDRLAEIEATRKKILSEYEFSRADDDMLMLLTSGIPWLLARVRELEAQAELMVDVYKGADLPELVARVNAAEARVRELGADNERLQTLCGNLAKTGGKHAHEEARLRGRVAELEAQAARDAMRIRQLQAQVVKDAVVREAIKTALECLSYRERCWNAEIWDALDVAIVAAEEEAK